MRYLKHECYTSWQETWRNGSSTELNMTPCILKLLPIPSCDWLIQWVCRTITQISNGHEKCTCDCFVLVNCFFFFFLVIANCFIILRHTVLFWVFCHIPFASYCIIRRRKKMCWEEVLHVLQAVKKNKKKNRSEQSQVEELSQTDSPAHPSDHRASSPDEPGNHQPWQIW